MPHRILIGILSGWQYPKRRQRCLTTWMPELADYPGRLEAVFLFGVPQLPQPERHGNALLLPCPNAYPFLPQRVAWFCRWALAQEWPFDWIFKTDDDTRLDVHRLAAYDLAGADYCGTEWRPGVGYASGGGYFLSRRAAAIVAENLLDWYEPHKYPHPEQPYEDLLVGKVLREHGVPLRIDNRHFKLFAAVDDSPGPGNDWVYATPAVREPD